MEIPCTEHKTNNFFSAIRNENATAVFVLFIEMVSLTVECMCGYFFFPIFKVKDI